MAASGCEWAHSLLRSAHEQFGDRHVPVPGRLALAPRAGAAQSYRAHLLGADAPARRAVAAPCAHLSSLSPEATWRHHLRQEPDAVIPLVRIRGGGYEQSSSLLRLGAPARPQAAGIPVGDPATHMPSTNAMLKGPCEFPEMPAVSMI